MFTMLTVDDVISRLESRAANHGLEVADLLEKMPSDILDSPSEVNEFLDMKDISHKYPVSTHPHLASDSDNWMWEDSNVNQERAAEVMTSLEQTTAHYDNWSDAIDIDVKYTDDMDPEWMDVLEGIPVDIDPAPIDWPMFF